MSDHECVPQPGTSRCFVCGASLGGGSRFRLASENARRVAQWWEGFRLDEHFELPPTDPNDDLRDAFDEDAYFDGRDVGT